MNYSLDIPRTAMEVYEMLPEGTFCEVIDNTIYMSPSPSQNHQELLGNLLADILFFLRKNPIGKVYSTPFDVYLNDGRNVVQPDIFFVTKDRLNVIQSKGLMGAPNIAIEILSSNKQHDQQRKFDLYQQNRVPEYVIIDPDTKEVWHYVLNNGAYQAKTDVIPSQLHLDQLDLTINF